MNNSETINFFLQLGEKIQSLSEKELYNLTQTAKPKNGWFTDDNIQLSLKGIKKMLDPPGIKKWVNAYPRNKKKLDVGIVMAGNIPLVGFHDLMSVLASNHRAIVKLSSKDDVLMRNIIEWLIQIDKRFAERIIISERLNDVQALLATGSNNSARYFEYYFRKIPKIIRKNRSSIAILEGNETKDDLQKLGFDIFSYFGLGCRNVSKVYLPNKDFLKALLDHFTSFEKVINHHKYKNNYDYQKTILLINQVEHLDNGFLLAAENQSLFSPMAVLYWEVYASKKQLAEQLKDLATQLQCVVGKDYTPFGQSQCPQCTDYADGIDTRNFLSAL